MAGSCTYQCNSHSSLVTSAGRVWLGITWPATQTALTGTSDFAEGSAISVNWLGGASVSALPLPNHLCSLVSASVARRCLPSRAIMLHAGLCMISLFVNLLWPWTAGHSDAPTNQTAHQAQPTPQTELQPACKHGTKLPFWKWAAALLLMTVCIRLGSTSVYVQTVSPEAAPVSPQQTSLTLLESTAAAHTVPFHAKEIAVSESSSAQVCSADTFPNRHSRHMLSTCHLHTLSISLMSSRDCDIYNSSWRKERMLDLRHLHLMLWPWKVLSLPLQRQLAKGQRRSKQRRCATFFNSCLQLSCLPTLQHLLCSFSQL